MNAVEGRSSRASTPTSARPPRRPRSATRAAAGETNSGTNVTMQTPAGRAGRASTSSGTLRGRVAHRAGRGVREDHRRLADVAARRASCRPRRGERSTSMPSRFISRTTSRRTARARRCTGSSVAESAHGDVVVVGQRQVAHAEHVQHPQRAERAADRVAALGADQRGDAARAARPASTSSRGAREGQLGRHTVPVIRCTASTCSSVAVTAASPCSVRGHEDRPELGADPALAQPRAGRCAWWCSRAGRCRAGRSRSRPARAPPTGGRCGRRRGGGWRSRSRARGRRSSGACAALLAVIATARATRVGA